MRYDKNAILNTAQKLRSKSSGLSAIQTSLSCVSPKKCNSTFYSKRSSLIRRLRNVQSEINALSSDIRNAASKMSSDDLQNAYHIRQVLSNRTSKISYGEGVFSAGNTELKRSGVWGSALLFSQIEMNRRSVSSLGNASSGSTPWYTKVGNFLKSGATSFGKKVSAFGSNLWNGASNFFSNAGKWGTERLNDLREWGKSAGEYAWKSITKFVLGDYSDDNITAMSFVGNIATGIFGVDLPLDVRDLVYDIQHWGEGDNFGMYFALDVVALLPVVGTLKYCKYADDIADGAKDLGKVLEATSEVGKHSDDIIDTVDNAKDLGKTAGSAADVGKTTDTIADTVDDVTDIGKDMDEVADATNELIDHYEELKTINQSLKNKRHIVTNVLFSEKRIELSDGRKLVGVFPEFDSCVDIQLPENLYKASFLDQKKYLIGKLKSMTDDSKQLSELTKRLGQDAIDDIKAGVLPEGFTWHHNEQEGLMQLVDTAIHDATAHTGGMSIWGKGY